MLDPKIKGAALMAAGAGVAANALIDKSMGKYAAEDIKTEIAQYGCICGGGVVAFIGFMIFIGVI